MASTTTQQEQHDHHQCLICLEESHDDGGFTCPECSSHACTTCARQYLLGNAYEHVCFQYECQKEWPLVLIRDALGKSWFTKTFMAEQLSNLVASERRRLQRGSDVELFKVMNTLAFLKKEIGELRLRAKDLELTIESEKKILVDKYKERYGIDICQWSVEEWLKNHYQYSPSEQRINLTFSVGWLEAMPEALSEKYIQQFTQKVESEEEDKRVFYAKYREYLYVKHRITVLRNIQTHVDTYHTSYLSRRQQLEEESGENTPVTDAAPTFQCPREQCTGNVRHGKCTICEAPICMNCREEQQSDEQQHECNPAVLKSLSQIRASTKPCPSCDAPIYKISGCSQMFCTTCHTLFDWNTMQIVRSRTFFHNPHLTEFLQQGGNLNAQGCGAQAQEAAQQLYASLYGRLFTKQLTYSVAGVAVSCNMGAKHRLQEFSYMCHRILMSMFPLSRDLSGEGLSETQVNQRNYQRMRTALTNASYKFSNGQITERAWIQTMKREFNLFHRNRLYYEMRQTMIDATASIIDAIPYRIEELMNAEDPKELVRRIKHHKKLLVAKKKEPAQFVQVSAVRLYFRYMFPAFVEAKDKFNTLVEMMLGELRHQVSVYTSSGTRKTKGRFYVHVAPKIKEVQKMVETDQLTSDMKIVRHVGKFREYEYFDGGDVDDSRVFFHVRATL